MVDGPEAEAAGTKAEAQGLLADILNIKKHTEHDNSVVVTAMIILNNQQIPVTTSHVGTEIVDGRLDVNGYTLVFHAMCEDYGCETYYTAMEIYNNARNNANLIIQQGQMRYFPEDGKDLYQWFTPEHRKPLIVQ